MRLRLEYLAPHVDRFYITEQRYTHQGKRKETLYTDLHKDWFEPYKAKVTILIDESEPSTEAWTKENRHRNYVMPWLLAEQGPWICTVCDCDEIPNLEAILQERQTIYDHSKKGAVYMLQEMYYYNFDWFVEEWTHPFILSDQTQPFQLQLYRDKKGPRAGLLRCGWHCSYFMSAAEIQRKLQSFAHTEFSTSEYTSLAHIQDALANGRDLFKRPKKPFERRDGKGLPSCFQEFNSRLKSTQGL